MVLGLLGRLDGRFDHLLEFAVLECEARRRK